MNSQGLAGSRACMSMRPSCARAFFGCAPGWGENHPYIHACLDDVRTGVHSVHLQGDEFGRNVPGASTEVLTGLLLVYPLPMAVEVMNNMCEVGRPSGV